MRLYIVEFSDGDLWVPVTHGYFQSEFDRGKPQRRMKELKRIGDDRQYRIATYVRLEHSSTTHGV